MPAETSASELVFRFTKAKSWAAYVGMQLLDDRENTMTPGVMVLNPEQKVHPAQELKPNWLKLQRDTSPITGQTMARDISSLFGKKITPTHGLESLSQVIAG